MSAERDRRAGEIFLLAAGLEGAARDAVVAAEVGGDGVLRAEVESLLRADGRNGGAFLSEPALGAGFNVMQAGGAIRDEPHPEGGPPTRIGPYHTLGSIAESDNVLVLLTEQREPVARRAAIKILRSSAARREVQKRFELERQAVALMEHPNIARLYDAGTTPDGRAYFAMEYVDGAPITTACAGLGVPERLRLFVQACMGIEHAHQRGIIHRDLKPSNLLVAGRFPSDLVVKVIDFGVATAIRSGLEDRTGLTLQGQVLGTPGYLAPERLSAAPRATGTLVDVYSLGAVLYEVLCGRAAFEFAGRGTAGAIAAIMNERPLRLGAIDRSLRGDLEAIVARAMEKEPGGRYQSVADLRRDVERFVSGRPVSARLHGSVYVARKFVMRHRVLTAVVAAAVMIAGSSLWRARAAEHAKYELATDLAGSWFELTVHMARTVGDRARRRPILEGLAEQSERFQKLAPNDVRVLRIRAAVVGSLADVAEEERDLDRATELTTEALQLRQRLATMMPDDQDAKMDLSIAMVRRGDMASQMEDQPLGLSLYQRAMALDRAMMARAPHNPRAVSNLAWSCLRLGACEGEPSSAASLLTEGLDRMLRVTQLRGDVDDIRGLANMNTQLGHLARNTGDFGAQRRFYEASRIAAFAARNMAVDNRLAGQQCLHSRMDCLSISGVDEEGRSSPEAWSALLDDTLRFLRRDPTDPESRVLMLAVFDRGMQDAERTTDLDAAERLGVMLCAELAAMIRERPDDESLVRSLESCQARMTLVQSKYQGGASPDEGHSERVR